MVQYQAIRTIGLFGTSALPCVPILETVLEDQNYQAAFAARDAIRRIRTRTRD